MGLNFGATRLSPQLQNDGIVQGAGSVARMQYFTPGHSVHIKMEISNSSFCSNKTCEISDKDQSQIF